jgi:hypothetical protein
LAEGRWRGGAANETKGRQSLLLDLIAGLVAEVLLAMEHHDVVGGEFLVADAAGGDPRARAVGTPVPVQTRPAEVDLLAAVAGETSLGVEPPEAQRLGAAPQVAVEGPDVEEATTAGRAHVLGQWRLGLASFGQVVAEARQISAALELERVAGLRAALLRICNKEILLGWWRFHCVGLDTREPLH